MRTPRRRSREFATQALYQGMLNPEYSVENLMDNIMKTDAFIDAVNYKKPKVDQVFFIDLVQGSMKYKVDYIKLMEPHLLDRKKEELSIIEQSILLIACYELFHYPETPYPVVINEAIEVAKVYGGTDSYKFINGILDKISLLIRKEVG